MGEFGTLILLAHGTETDPPDVSGTVREANLASLQARDAASVLNEAKISPDVIYTATSNSRFADMVMAALRVLPRRVVTDSRLNTSLNDRDNEDSHAMQQIHEFYTDEIVFGLLRRETLVIVADESIIRAARIVLNVDPDLAALSIYTYDRYLRPTSEATTAR